MILSESFCHVSAIIKNVCIAAKIHTSGLDITAHTNQKADTLIILQRIGQFLIDRWPKHRELADVNQTIINRWFDNSGITIGSMADTLEKKI